MTSNDPAVPALVADTASVSQQPVPKTHVPAMDHALKARALQTNWAARAAGNAAATVQLAAFGMDAKTWEELLQIQMAAWQRLRTLQMGWVEDWKGWIRYSDKIKGANTMSKLVEREYNIVAQLAQLLGEQATGLVGLQENIEVDYSYWVNEKLNEKKKSFSGVDFAK